MKLFLIGWDNKDKVYVNSAKKLESAGHEIIYWSGGSNEKSYEESRKAFPNTVFHLRQDAINGRRPEEYRKKNFTPLGEDIIQKFYLTESILQTMKNFDKLDLSGLAKKRLYHEFLEYWHGVLSEFKPDAVIFGVWPHTGYNYIVYCLAKYLNIKTIMFEYARIGDRLLLINDFTEGSRELKVKLKEAQRREIKLDDLSKDIRDYFLAQTSDGRYDLPPDIKILSERFKGFKKISLKFKIIFNSLFDLTIFWKAVHSIKKRKSNLKKEYESLEKQPDFTKKYVYAAIHYQPECSTSPLGGAFVDQVLMIKILSASIPDGWEIYIKEHPYQWLPTGLAYSPYRYEGFYEEMAKIDKVSLVPMKVSTKELIKKSQATATVTGTAGWEALINLKPAIIFGHAWYRDCPGNFRVNSLETCRQAVAKINYGLNLSRQEIINYLWALDQSTFHAYLEEVVELQSRLSPEENSENIFKALSRELNNSI